MSSNDESGTFQLGDRHVARLGYGAMQLAGPGVFGPPNDPGASLAVLRDAVASGVNHIDTADFYGPHVTNRIIREALHPYPKGLVIVTKVGARRGADASWIPAFSPEELTQAVHDNLRNLGLEVLDVVNLRSMFGIHGPAEGSIEAPLMVLAELQRKGLVRHIGLSNVTPTQIAEGRRVCEIVCVQNLYNLAHRRSGQRRHRLCAILPTWRVHATAVDGPIRCRRRTRCYADAGSARLAAAARTQHPADSRHLIGCTSLRKPGGGQPGAAERRADHSGQDSD